MDSTAWIYTVAVLVVGFLIFVALIRFVKRAVALLLSLLVLACLVLAALFLVFEAPVF